jgi:hypothetical protein
MIYLDVNYLYFKVFFHGPPPTTPPGRFASGPSEINGVHIWLILMKAHRALA